MIMLINRFIVLFQSAIPNIESIGEGPDTIRTGFTSLVSLAPGESIVVAIKRDTSITSKNIVVVYEGRIGDEKGLAVCTAQTAIDGIVVHHE